MMELHKDAALLDAYLDGELTGEERDAVTAHLEACAVCREYVDAWRQVRRSMPGAEDTPPPEAFSRRVMEAVAKHPRKNQPWGKLAAAAACLALIVLWQYGVSGQKRLTGGGGSVTLYSASGETAPDAAPEAAAGSPSNAQENAAPSPREDGETGKDALSPPMSSLSKGHTEQEDLAVIALTGEQIGDALETLLPDRQPEETSPGYARYRLSRRELADLLSAMEDREGLPALPAEGDAFYLEVWEE